MKLRTSLTASRDGSLVDATDENLIHDAAAAHALMQAMDEFYAAPLDSTLNTPEDAINWLEWRASELMREWGFDSGEGCVMEWMPIETAPRDARILICRKGDECSHAGFWQEAVEDGVDYMGEDAGFVDVDFQVFFPSRTFGQLASQYEGRQPTLWMPLPPPPTDRRTPEQPT